ncbi:MAG: DNA repair protein RecO C-terminal domain-containing protein [Bacteroidales bacterium]|nr:DNA repair protein RecO C-terminal domain-containing protein [Bacteroidales bacterium]
MTRTLRLIVLHSTKFGEKTLVLHGLCDEGGRSSFLVPAGRGAAMLMPLSILEGEAAENPRSELRRLHGVSALYPLTGLRTNPGKSAISLFLSEVLYRSVREDAFSEALFDWCCRQILALDALPRDFSNFHLRFLLEYAAILGFAPSGEGLMPFAGARLSGLLALSQAPFADAMLLPFSGAQRSEMADALLRYLGFHLEMRLDVRSLKVLRELFR